jgi:RNA polymerase sigma-70 factor (ECF subfamily)
LKDSELLKKIGHGDQECFEELYTRHKGLVYGLAKRLLVETEKAEEATQEVWMRVVKNAKSFSENEKLELGGVKAWIAAITRNYCLNELAKKKEFLRQNFEEDEVIPEQADHGPLADQLIEHEEELQRFKKALEQLPDSQRACLVIWMETQKPYEDLAKDLKTSVANIKVLMFRARANLEEWMKGGGHER